MAEQAGGGSASRRLAAIMFTDVVGYSELSHRDEALAIELLALHRTWVRELLPAYGGREISTIGDAFLIEFGGALAAVECAVAIQRRFADYNAAAPAERRIELRVGIHLGDIEYHEGNVLGDGVNLASRIHGMAEPGGICVSEQVFHAVRNRSDLVLRSIGRQKLKNISTVLELYRLETSGPGARPRTARSAWPRRGLAIGAALALALLSIVAALRLVPRQPAEIPSVAVLPFENLSADPENAFFTDGLHDSVIGHLARVRNLKVISRTSVMGYRGKHASLGKIADELGVAHIVEGSVQRAGGRMRVVAQLIDARTDAHVWSSEYERDISDVFAVQADLARQVAAAVHATLTPQERDRIDLAPTTNPAAYDLYLKALMVQRGWAHFSTERAFEGAQWVDQAIAQDPQFALAHALAAYLHDALYWDGIDPTVARHQRAVDSAAEALRLGPELAEAHVAQALVLYHDRRYSDAVRELETASELSPGSSEVEMQLVWVYRRQGRWAEALAAGQRGVWLDPLNEKMLESHLGTLQATHRYEEAEAMLARLQQAAADARWIPLRRAENRFWLTGDLDGFESALDALNAAPDDCTTVVQRVGVAGMRGRHAQAAEIALACKETLPEAPQEMWAALSYREAGDVARAREYGERALRLLSRAAAETANPGRVKIGMALARAATGDKAGALRDADAALRATPLSFDAVQAPSVLHFAAMVYALLGEPERALDALQQALALPGGPHAQEVRLDPAFEALRQNPQFEQVVAAHLPR